MTVLMDVNTLVAALCVNHVHHVRAQAWLSGQTSVASTPITQLGFVRVAVQAGLVASVSEARTLLESFAAAEVHEFWPDALGVNDPRMPPVSGPKQLTDSHLVALARQRTGKLATFDRGILGLPGVSPEQVELLS